MKKYITTFSLVVAALDFGLRSNPFLSFYKEEAVSKPEYEVAATMYNATTSQCDKDPLVTAAMFRIHPSRASSQKFVALSRDMLKRWGGPFEYGDSIIVSNAGEKDGVYVVADVMNRRFKHRLDFLETKGTKHYKLDKIKITKK
jgi:hypothetical protein